MLYTTALLETDPAMRQRLQDDLEQWMVAGAPHLQVMARIINYLEFWSNDGRLALGSNIVHIKGPDHLGLW